jgi:hypothetical protein
LFAAPLSRQCNFDETKSHGDFNPWRAIRVGGGLENLPYNGLGNRGIRFHNGCLNRCCAL